MRYRYHLLWFALLLLAACTTEFAPVLGEKLQVFPEDGSFRLLKIWESTADSAGQIFWGIEVFSDSSFVVAGRETESHEAGAPGSSRLTWFNADGEEQSSVSLVGNIGEIHALPNRNVLAAVEFEDENTFKLEWISPAGEISHALSFPGRLSLGEGGMHSERGAFFIFDVLPDGAPVVFGQYVGALILGAGEVEETMFSAETPLSFLAAYRSDGTLASAASVNAFFQPKRLIASPDGGIYVIGIDVDRVRVLAFDITGTPALRFGDMTSTKALDETFDFEVNGFIATDDSLVLPGVLMNTAYFPNETGDPIALTAPSEVQGDNQMHRDNLFIARYLPNGTLDYAFLEGNKEFDHCVGTPIGAHALPTYTASTLLCDNTVLTAGDLHGTVTFGRAEENETTLKESKSPQFIAAYNLDGSLAFAEYLNEKPTVAGLAAAPDGTFIVVSDGLEETPVNDHITDISVVPLVFGKFKPVL